MESRPARQRSRQAGVWDPAAIFGISFNLHASSISSAHQKHKFAVRKFGRVALMTN